VSKVFVKLPVPPSMNREQFQELLMTAGVRARGCDWEPSGPSLLCELELLKLASDRRVGAVAN